MDELENIRKRYEARKKSEHVQTSGSKYFEHYHRTEKEKAFTKILKRKFGNDFSQITLMEIGAGTGKNLHHFLNLGFCPENIWANELLEDRFQILQSDFRGIHCEPGDASTLPYENKFDIVLQSTVFTSILDHSFKKKLADKLLEMTKPGGFILWYDFVFNNPNNKNVKGIPKKEIKELFPNAKSIEFKKVTLAPPIGRRVKKMYNLANGLFPFLRTHVIATITK
jgi:hypothetical protein